MLLRYSLANPNRLYRIASKIKLKENIQENLQTVYLYYYIFYSKREGTTSVYLYMHPLLGAAEREREGDRQTVLINNNLIS